MPVGRTIADGYIELRLDDSKLDAQTRNKAQRVAKDFGTKLNSTLNALSIDEIDLKANPRDALAAIDRAEDQLKHLSRTAESLEVKFKTDTTLAELGRLKKRLGDVGDDAGKSFGTTIGVSTTQGIFATLTGAFKPPPPQVLAAVAGLGVAMTPLLGGALAAGVIGGAAGLGIVGGFALAAKDQRVQAAAEQMKSRLEGRLMLAGGAFVPPVLHGMREVERSVDRIDLDGIFRNAARYVPTLTGGVTSAIDDLGEGFTNLVGRAGPVVNAFSRSIASVGATVGDSLTRLAGDAEAGASAVDDLTVAATNLVEIATWVVHGLAQIKSGLDSVDDGIDNFRHKLEDALSIGDIAGAQFDITADGMTNMERRAKEAGEGARQMGGGFFGAAGGIRKAGDDAAKAVPPVNRLATQVRALHEQIAELVGKNLSAAEASLRLRQALYDATAAIDGTRKVTFGEQQALVSLARATNTSTAALDEQGRTVGQATRAHEANRKKLIETAVKMGYTRAQAKLLANQYLAIPKGVGTTITQPGMPKSRTETKKYHDQLNKLTRQIRTSITVTGEAAAYRKLNALLAQQQALKKGITVSAAASAIRKQGIPGLAGGGPVRGAGRRGVDSVQILAAPGEFMHRTDAVDYYGVQAMKAINAKRVPREVLQGYQTGGLVAPFRVNAAVTRIPGLDEVLRVVTPAIPRAGATAPAMERLLERMFGVAMISGFRRGARTLSGALSYHALNRAVDFPPIKAMAAYMDRVFGPRLLEAITPWQQYNRYRGRRHTYSGAVWRQHNFAGGNAHNHFAMDGGGYLMPGWNPPLYNGTGRPEPVIPGPDMARVAWLLERIWDELRRSASGGVGTRKAVEDVVVAALGSAQRRRRL